MKNGTAKITISIPVNLINVTDQIAKEKKVSRSKVVAFCLQELVDKRLQEKMAEGYKALAKEHAEFAEKSLHLADEVIHDWK